MVDSMHIDAEWHRVLAHRHASAPESDITEIVGRFVECELEPHDVEAVLADGGDSLYAAAASRVPGWADEFGGPLAVALLAAEVSALSAHLTSRSSAVRSVAVDLLLDDYSAVTVAAELGVSRQKVYEIARGGLKTPYLDFVPWRKP